MVGGLTDFLHNLNRIQVGKTMSPKGGERPAGSTLVDLPGGGGEARDVEGTGDQSLSGVSSWCC